MSHPLFPEIPYLAWRDTLTTVHRFAQLVGKVRLAASPRRNHWWNVPFHLTGRGITTRPMGRDPIFAIDFDFLDHRLDIATVEGARYSFALPGLSVAKFTAQLTHGLAATGVDVTIQRPHPFDLPDAHRPFAQDTEHHTYDTAAVTRYWRVLSQVNLLLEEFAGRWSSKTSPVHHFWHTFDIALTRFADNPVEHPRPPTRSPARLTPGKSSASDSGSATTPSPNQRSTPTPRPNPTASPTNFSNPKPRAGPNAAAVTSRYCAMTTSGHCLTRTALSSTSTKAPIRPAPAVPAGTAPGTSHALAPPTPTPEPRSPR
jgi:hypothetical protein